MEDNIGDTRTGVRIRFDRKGEAVEGYDKDGRQWPGSQRGSDKPDGPLMNTLHLTADRHSWQLKNEKDPEPWGCVSTVDGNYLEVALDEELAAVEAKPDRGTAVGRGQGCNGKLSPDARTRAYELRQGATASAVRCCWVNIQGRWYCLPY